VVSNTGGKAERELRSVQMLQERRVDGLIVTPVTLDDPALLALRREKLPLVQIDRSVKGADIPCVRTDHVAGSKLAVDHLVARGRRRIAFVTGPSEIQTFSLRLNGFLRALASHGLKPQAVEVVRPEAAPAEEAVRRLLAGKTRPDAVYTANIWMTLGSLRAVRAAGVADVDLVGFDDISMADLFTRPVTTVAQDVEAIGRESFRALLGVMKGERVPRETLVAPRLVVRG
jgi:LacI family transcriptional regulator